MIILLDNGHGRETGGKCSPDGRLKEYAYAREIAARVRGELVERGYDARILVPEINDIHVRVRAQRVNQICRQFGKQNVLVVSIHCNGSGTDGKWHDAHGWEAWTYFGQTDSDILAEYLYQAAEKHFPGHKMRKDTLDGDSDKEGDLCILRETACAAVLTENFFQDTESEVNFMLTEACKEALTDTHVEGIINFINRKK